MITVEYKVELTCTNCGYSETHEVTDADIEMWYPPPGAIVIVHSTTTLFPKWTRGAGAIELLCPHCSAAKDKKEA